VYLLPDLLDDFLIRVELRGRQAGHVEDHAVEFALIILADLSSKTFVFDLLETEIRQQIVRSRADAIEPR
jgi:hypothetical protein